VRLRAALEAATPLRFYLVTCALRKRAGVQRAWGSQVLCRWRMVDLGPPVMLQPHPGFGCGQPAQRNDVGVRPMPSGFKRWWQPTVGWQAVRDQCADYGKPQLRCNVVAKQGWTFYGTCACFAGSILNLTGSA